MTIAWYVLGSATSIGAGKVITTSVIAAPTSYYFTAANGCSGGGQFTTDGVQASEEAAQSPVVTVTPLSVPGVTLTATLTANNQIQVSWGAVAGSTSYRLLRCGGSGWQLLTTVTTNAYLDTTVTAGKTYAYRVEQLSGVDLATVMTFTPVIAQQPVLVSQFDQLLAIVNAVRGASGWKPLVWSDLFASTQPLPAVGAPIRASQLSALRVRMNEALQALGIASTAYADPEPLGQAIKASHINELQGRAQ
jgi:hypothetical protein